MATAGPELPPHLLAKRKRQQTESRSPLPSPPPRSRSSSVSSVSVKLRRIQGPSLPPAPLSELPPTAPSPARLNDEPDSDDDIGPSLPTDEPSLAEIERQQTILEEEKAASAAAQKPQRDEWMLVPPTSDDWSSRVDPTKLRNRKFNTGKGSKAPPPKRGDGDGITLWTETPEQKRKRLEDEVMGVKRPAQLGREEKQDKLREEENKVTARRIQEYNVCPVSFFPFAHLHSKFEGEKERNRKTSLYSEHKKAVPKEKEDDPSKRAFDKEKDIGGGIKIGHAQKKALLNRAADFGSRFSGGSYL
ncbi:hypothetical protein MMC07_006990 [Pseudocyphellaria aurata]|nr:hypothetical protein [Pseudocyphellaria aurata]